MSPSKEPLDTPTPNSPSQDDNTAALPLIDISQVTPKVGAQLVSAAAKWGFFWIFSSPPTNSTSTTSATDPEYDFDEETVDSVFSLSQTFFKTATDADKDAVRVKHDRGYINMHVENLDPGSRKRGDFKQAFNLSEPSNTNYWDSTESPGWLQPLPQVFQENERMLADFHARCRRTTDRILRLLALGLQVSDPTWLSSRHSHPSEQKLRMLYYPSLPPSSDYNKATDIRAGAHSDYLSITLLFQRPGQPGLEILNPEGKWVGVPIFPEGYHSETMPPVLVNIGDLLEYWTGGLLRSTVHRVILREPESSPEGVKDGKEAVLKGEDRYSMAVFIGPKLSEKLVPIPSPLIAERGSDSGTVGYGGGAVEGEDMKTITAGDHLARRLEATYGKTVFERDDK